MSKLGFAPRRYFDPRLSAAKISPAPPIASLIGRIVSRPAATRAADLATYVARSGDPARARSEREDSEDSEDSEDTTANAARKEKVRSGANVSGHGR